MNPAGLTPGQYFGLVNFTAAGATDAPQSVEVALTILPSAPTNGPLISPAAVMFVGSASATPASQSVQFINLSSQTLTVSATPTFVEGNGWYGVTSSASTAAPGQALTWSVTANTTGLAAGQYFGTLELHAVEIDANYAVAVVLVVPQTAVSTARAARAAIPAATPGCAPTQLLPVFTNLESGFQTTAGLPVTVQVQVSDDCGNPLTSGSVVAYFPSGDPPVSLTYLGNATPLGSGQWAGSWLPHNAAGGAASVGVIATSFSPALYGSAGVTGTLAANAVTPIVSPGYVVSAASGTVGGPLPLAPGSFISIFGSNFAAGSNSASSYPYPINLAGMQVTLGGEALPLQFAGSPSGTYGQINAIVPYNVALNSTEQIVVELNGSAYSMPETVSLAVAQPTVFTLNQSGTGAGAILTVKPNGAEAVNSPSAPASFGDALEVFCTGLGAVSPPLQAGTAASLTQLSYTVDTVTATIGGQGAQVIFAGLAPGYVGYQVNVLVPSGVTGAALPLVLTEDGISSPPVTVAIQ